MKFKIPFTFSDTEVLKRRSRPFTKFISQKRGKLDESLKNAGQNLSRQEYLSICLRSFLINLLMTSIVLSSILVLAKRDFSLFYISLGSALMISGFVFLIQRNYPRSFALGKSRDIDKNLISALQDIIVQLDSGIPIFRIMVNLSESDYGEVSAEFKKIVKEINSGIPQVEAIEKCGKANTSEYFRRVLWQISNGMRAGSDMSFIIKESARNLGAEQSIQIQSYGGKLNPIIMFYMLIAVILPSLGITFLIIISSLLGISGKIVQIIFILIFVIVMFIQIMFLGVIKSRRPSLL